MAAWKGLSCHDMLKAKAEGNRIENQIYCILHMFRMASTSVNCESFLSSVWRRFGQSITSIFVCVIETNVKHYFTEVFHYYSTWLNFPHYSSISGYHGISVPVLLQGSDKFHVFWSLHHCLYILPAKSFTSWHNILIGRWSALVCFRGAELFQATIVKAVRARLEEERKSVEQLKRQWDNKYLIYFILYND